MDADTAAALGFGLGAVGIGVATPIAIRVAVRTEFYDHPRGYRQHVQPTPLLGGSAVLAAFLLPALAVGGASKTFGVLLLGALAMWAIGTVDDRMDVAPIWRVVAEAAVAVALFAGGLGWRLHIGSPLNLLLTMAWIVSVVNAFNLMDNLDGACGTVGCASAIGIGTLALIYAEPVLAGMAFALAAACGGFLRWNLARPAKIFLGDGGSMLVGCLVASLGMAASRHLPVGDGSILAIGLAAGAVIFDTTLVSVSRTRRGVTLMTGGHDHLTHRLCLRLGSARAIAVALAAFQGLLCGLAIASVGLGSSVLVAVSIAVVLLGVILIAVLDSATWRPAGVAVAEPSPTFPAAAGELEPAHLDIS